MPELKIGVLASNDLTYTNSLYINPTNLPPHAPPQLLLAKIGSTYIPVTPSAQVPVPEVQMNRLQRTHLRVSRDQALELSLLTCAPSSNQLISADCEVNTLKKSPLQIKATALSSFLKAALKAFPLSLSPLVLDYEGTMLTVTFSELFTARLAPAGNASSDSKGIAEMEKLKFGFLTEKTEVAFSSAGASLKIINDSTRRKNIFSPSLAASTAGNSEGNPLKALGIGGLDRELEAMLKRVFITRTMPAHLVSQLGLQHVKGLLLFGPPGTGKTLIARKISQILDCRSLRVVNGPEVLNKYVGASEENIRALFAEAEEDFRERGEEAELHIVIFDEIDAICKQRGASAGGTGVNDSVVNQLLSKMDGIDALNNILVIGMTNRKDMIDGALLRPGRFEAQIEIGLPDERGRRDIFRIHTERLREFSLIEEGVDYSQLAAVTKNYSGAEIQGVVKCAIALASFAHSPLNPSHSSHPGGGSSGEEVESIRVTEGMLLEAVREVKPAFGAELGKLGDCIRKGFYLYSPAFASSFRHVGSLVRQVHCSGGPARLSVLLEGSSGSGTSAFASRLAMEGGFEYSKIVSAEGLVGLGEAAVAGRIRQTFLDAYKSPKSLIVLDSIERLIGYVPIGPRFLNAVLQTLMVMVKQHPAEVEGKEPRRLVVLATTSKSEVVLEFGLKEIFDVVQFVPRLEDESEYRSVIRERFKEGEVEGVEEIVESLKDTRMGIKRFLMLLDLAKDDEGKVTYENFASKRFFMNV